MDGDWSKDEVTRDLANESGSPVASDDGHDLEQMERMQRLELSAVLAAGLAHDLATPLSTLKVSLATIGQSLADLEELMRDAGLSGRGAAAVARGRKAAQAIDEVSDYMQRLARDFTRFTRGGRAGSAGADVRSAVDTAVRYTRATVAHRASLAVRVPRSLLAAMTDRTLVRVLANLLLNAAQAFTTSDPAKNWIVITADEADGKVAIDICDNAGGIPPKVRMNLFAPFVTSKRPGQEPGLGLGLAVARALARESGGDLALIASGPSETRFRVTLPVGGPGR